MKISVVIPCFNASGSIRACLESMAVQTRAPDEVIVVDNGSTDGTLDRARSMAPSGGWPLRLLTESRRGPSSARNRGAWAASGDVLSFLDADCRASPDYLATVEAELSEGIEACGGAIGGRAADGDFVSRFLSVFLFYPRCRKLYREIHHASSACFSIRASWFRRLEGFDETMTEGEDVDISLRLYREGGRILFDPKLCVEHQHAETIGSLLHKTYRYGRIQPFIFKRHYAGTSVVNFVGKRKLIHGTPHTVVIGFASLLKPLLVLAVIAALVPPLASSILAACALGMLCAYVFMRLKNAAGTFNLIEFPAMVILFAINKITWEIGCWAGALKHRVLVV